MPNKQKVVAIDYHRNGVCGHGFHVGIVEEVEDGEQRRMLVVRFPKTADKQTGAVMAAAFDLELLKDGVIEFGQNSWRGDRYHSVMDKAIAEREK